MECFCDKFSPASTMGKEGADSEEKGYALVEAHIAKSLVLIGKDRWYSQSWKSTPSTTIEVTRTLEDGGYYCCQVCSSSFLIVLDKSNEDYLVLLLDPKELGESTPFELRKRFSTAFEVMPQSTP